MKITLKGDQVIPSHDVHACLLGALEESRNQPKTDLVFRFRYSPPEPAQVSVALMGGFWHNDLTYGDVATVLRGLQTFLATRDEYVALLYFLEDEHRSAIGDGCLGPSRVEASDLAETMGANGSILRVQVSLPGYRSQWIYFLNNVQGRRILIPKLSVLPEEMVMILWNSK